MHRAAKLGSDHLSRLRPAFRSGVLGMVLGVASLGIGGCSSSTNPSDSQSVDGVSESPQDPFEDAAQKMVSTPAKTTDQALPDPPSVATETEGTFQLPPEATPQQLLRSLAELDGQMRRVANQETALDTPVAIQGELTRLAKIKLEAANRMIAGASVPPELLKQGKRGKLQALSHLFALGDTATAPVLEEYAKELAASTDPTLAVESRLVLIGFAMEALQVDDDPQPVVDLVEQLSNNAQVLDMPALMAMGQARSGLQEYGYADAARQVRDHIVHAFENHPDPNIQAMAAALADSERFDVINALRRDLEQGRRVTPSQWQLAANNLVRRGPDLDALRYLSEAALWFEDTGREEFAKAANEVIASGFTTTTDPAVEAEQQMVLATYEARQSIVGKPLVVDLPDTKGSPLQWSSYRGKVVLMPFWAAEHPESISVFRQLEAIRDQASDQIALIGVNVDFEEASLAAFERQIQLDWPSLRSPDPRQQGIENPLAAQVGVSSFPFVVLIDRDGVVRRLFMTNLGIEEAVKELLSPSSPTP